MLLLIVSLVAFTGCSGDTTEGDEPETVPVEEVEEPAEAEEPEELEETEEAEVVGEWSFTVEVIGGDTYEITNEVAKEIGPVNIMAAEKDGDDVSEEREWTGILLTDLVEYVGVDEYLVVAIEGADGESRELEADRLDEERTGFGWMVDGEELDEEAGPIQLINHHRGPKWWIKDVTKVTIIQ